jgi:hypothetical protein
MSRKRRSRPSSYDQLRRAQAIRDEALYKAALLGPRI